MVYVKKIRKSKRRKQEYKTTNQDGKIWTIKKLRICKNCEATIWHNKISQKYCRYHWNEDRKKRTKETSRRI